MNATIATICDLLQTLLPQSKVIATIELLQMLTLHSNQMLQLQQQDYTILHCWRWYGIYGAFTLDVKSVLNGNLGGIIGDM
jgi:hypothetical protein